MGWRTLRPGNMFIGISTVTISELFCNKLTKITSRHATTNCVRAQASKITTSPKVQIVKDVLWDITERRLDFNIVQTKHRKFFVRVSNSFLNEMFLFF